MSRIPDSFIQDLIARTDIVDVIGSRMELKRAGKEYKGLSPFTHEKTASFFVSPTKQMYFDFSSGKNGTVISFLMDYDRLSFVEAVEELAKRAGVEVPRDGDHGPQRIVLEGPLDALAAAERIFREQLRTAQPAIDYLKKRGLNGATAKLFGIGYAPESWDALTRSFPDPQHALTAGLLIQKDGGGPRDASRPGNQCYDRFRNRIMFPIRDTRGRVIAFGGRTLGNDPAKYLNSPETPLFHKGRNLYGLFEAKQSSKSDLPYLLVVEGYMDTVMLAQHGVRNVVATLGTATTREHLNLLFKATPRVVFCFDGDRAGRSAAVRALEQVLPELSEGRECRFMFLPEGKDPDDLVQEIGPDAFRALVDKAQPLPDYLLAELTKQVNLATRDGRVRLAELARPLIGRMREGPARALLIDELWKRSALTRVDFDTLMAGGGERAAAPGGRPDPATGTFALTVRRALQCLIERPSLASSATDANLLAQADLPGVPLLMKVLHFLKEHPNSTVAQVFEAWRETPEGVQLVAVLAGEQLLADKGDPEKDFADACSILRELGLKAQRLALLTATRGRQPTPEESLELEGLNRQLARRGPV